MIDWRDITLEDKARIEDKICASGCHGADYGFANLFIWRKAYRPKIAFCDNRLLVGMPQWNVYAYPKGDGDVRSSTETGSRSSRTATMPITFIHRPNSAIFREDIFRQSAIT